ncbi:MAG: sulfatase-like hydrolase/transferase [Candidatus Kuenenia sp.]|nr:sulfatase-like hydrolase/transferase [Candidatus Kuenenia sp.]
MKNNPNAKSILWRYFFLSYAVVLANTLFFLKQISYSDTITTLFGLSIYLTYSFIYLFLAFIPILILELLLRKLLKKQGQALFRQRCSAVISGISIALFTIVQLLILTDKQIFKLYQFHINGFVWNLITTPGGLESLGSSDSTFLSVAIIITGLFVLQIVLFVLAKSKISQTISSVVQHFRPKKTFTILIIILFVFQFFTYGISHLESKCSVLSASNAFPLYVPVTFGSWAKRFGISPKRTAQLKLDRKDHQLHYPLQPMQYQQVEKKYNIVWLVAESWRADMLNHDVMPHTMSFAEKSTQFDQHYSGGNGTRMGLFSMFYGLYGSYWFAFLHSRKGPVFIDRLIALDYQMELFTSAKFSYPELDKTIFTGVPNEKLHEYIKKLSGWENDRKHVTSMIRFIEQRDKTKPFFTFMFFESPHARYYFPEESIIKTPFLENLNYATMNVEKDIELIKNRYINSCYHLDSQFGRIFSYLESNQLLEKTIVVVTGDHGEEFMENGHWGHNSAYTEEQIRVPLVIWLPENKPSHVKKMTSHLDLPATLMPLLGATSPASDYSLGHDLFAPSERTYTIVCDWDSLCYINHDYKAVFPLQSYNFLKQTITSKTDKNITDRKGFFATSQNDLVQLMKDIKKFNMIGNCFSPKEREMGKNGVKL